MDKQAKALQWNCRSASSKKSDIIYLLNKYYLCSTGDFAKTSPTPLDALAYGHIRAILSSNGPKAALMIKPITSTLLRHIVRMTNLTQMPLTPQEDYLLTQASHISFQKNIPSEVNITKSISRIKRSKLCIKNSSRDAVAGNRDVFGFKPFASKQIIIMTSGEGKLICEYDDPYKHYVYSNDNYRFIIEFIEEIIKTTEKIISEKEFVGNDKDGFEIISVLNSDDSNNLDIDNINEYLDTIEENDLSHTTTSIGTGEDLIQIINEDDEIDSDGLVNEKHLLADANAKDYEPEKHNELKKKYHSKSKEYIEEYLDLNTKASFALINSKQSSASNVSGSKHTIISCAANDEISVESLMDYMRKKNAIINSGVEIAEVD